MLKTRRDSKGIYANANTKDLFGSTLLCILNSFGYDGIENNDKVDVLKDILAIGYKRKFDVDYNVKLSLEVISERHNKEFVDKIKEALNLVGYIDRTTN